MRLFKIFSLIILWNISYLYSDTIILKNGNILKGKIVNLANSKVVFIKENGQTIELSKEEVAKIQLERQKEVPNNKKNNQVQQNKPKPNVKKTQNIVPLPFTKKESNDKLNREKELETVYPLSKQEPKKQKEEKSEITYTVSKEEPKKEEVKYKGPLILRKYMEIGYGLGPTYFEPYFINLFNRFNFGKNTIGGSIFLPASLSGLVSYQFQDNEYEKYHLNHYLFINYFYNHWSFGFDITLLQLNTSINVNKYGISKNSLFFSLSNANFEKKPMHLYSHFWIRYDWYRIDLNRIFFLLGVKGGYKFVNTSAGIIQNSILFDTFLNEKHNIKSTKGDLFFLGPSLMINLSEEQNLQMDLYYIGGSLFIDYQYQKLATNYFTNYYTKFSNKGSGGGIEIQYNKKFSKEMYLFVKYVNTQISYNIGNTNDLWIKLDYTANNLIPYFFTGILAKIFNPLNIQKEKSEKEVIQSLNLGIRYLVEFK